MSFSGFLKSFATEYEGYLTIKRISFQLRETDNISEGITHSIIDVILYYEILICLQVCYIYF